MGEKITKLFDDLGLIRCDPIGVVFPIVFRLTGLGWQSKAYEDSGAFVPDPKYLVTEYTLAEEPVKHIAKASYAPITHLDRTKDDTWVIVRCHRTRQAVDGYLDGLVDLEQGDDRSGRAVYQNGTSFFTIATRKANVGCQNNLLIYTATLPDKKWGIRMWTRVVKSDGTMTDGEILYPPEGIWRRDSWLGD